MSLLEKIKTINTRHLEEDGDNQPSATSNSTKRNKIKTAMTLAAYHYVSADLGLGQSDEDRESEGLNATLVAPQTGFEAIENEESIAQIIHILKSVSLTEKEWMMIYYILNESQDNGRTITTFAREWGVTRQRASQVFIKMQRKVRSALFRRTEDGDGELVVHSSNELIDHEAIQSEVERIIERETEYYLRFNQRIEQAKRAKDAITVKKTKEVEPEPLKLTKTNKRKKTANKPIAKAVISEASPSDQQSVETAKKVEMSADDKFKHNSKMISDWLMEKGLTKTERYFIRTLAQKTITHKEITLNKLKAQLPRYGENSIATAAKKTHVGLDRAKNLIQLLSQ